MYEVQIGIETFKYVNTISKAFTIAISYYHQGWAVTVINKETRELILSLILYLTLMNNCERKINLLEQ